MKALRNTMLAAYTAAALLAIGGCEKSSNVSAMQDEAAGIANHYRSRFEELHKRYLVIDKSEAKKAIDESKDIKPVWSALQRRLGELRNGAQSAQNSIAAAMKGPNTSADLIRLQADLRERFERGETEVVGMLGTVETWISNRAYAPKVATVTPPPPTDVPHDEHPHADKLEGVKDGDMSKRPPTGDLKDHVDGAKHDAPKADAPKTDVKKDEPKKDAPKANVPKADAPKTDGKKDAPKAEPKKDAPKAGSGSGR